MPISVNVMGKASILAWKIASPVTFIIEKAAPAINI
jgi:hypothetical protein